MPGTRITDQQVTIYMKHRKRNSQVIAAAKAGISERSARRIDKLDEQPLSNKRQWRTRIDPLNLSGTVLLSLYFKVMQR
nr:hypothetical protein [Pseudoalteromonas sp. NZS127]